MRRSLYDFTVPPDMPEKLYRSLYYFPHEQGYGTALHPSAPAYKEPPCMVAHYDESNNLKLVRFIKADGSYIDEVIK